MTIHFNSGLLETTSANIRIINSPNFDDRPTDATLDLIVIHNISLPPGEFGGPWIDALFTNSLDPEQHDYFKQIHEMKVSSHALIRRDGEIVQYVPFNKRAWHAGKSNYLGREHCNDFAVGIELEGDDDSPFESEQYEQLAWLISELINTYPNLSTEHITGHSDIAPGRKTDPGPFFEWHRLSKLLSAG